MTTSDTKSADYLEGRIDAVCEILHVLLQDNPTARERVWDLLAANHEVLLPRPVPVEPAGVVHAVGRQDSLVAGLYGRTDVDATDVLTDLHNR